jgi:hypothetical protein
MCVDDESIDDDPKLWWACQAIIYWMSQRQRCPSAAPRCASRVSVPYIDRNACCNPGCLSFCKQAGENMTIRARVRGAKRRVNNGSPWRKPLTAARRYFSAPPTSHNPLINTGKHATTICGQVFPLPTALASQTQ